MPEPQKLLSGQRVLVAKVRCLDKLIGAANFDEVNDEAEDDLQLTEWEQNFIGSLKDQIDRLHQPIRFKQETVLNQIWEKANLGWDISYEDFLNEAGTR